MRPRIRSIKPDIFHDEQLWALGEDTHMPILQGFQGLWCYADREGRFEWRPLALKSLILPYWRGDFEELLGVLVGAAMVVRYVVDGRVYGWVRNFAKHQAINNKEVPSVLPEPPSAPVPIASPRVEVASPSREPRVEHAFKHASSTPAKGIGNGIGIGSGMGLGLGLDPERAGEASPTKPSSEPEPIPSEAPDPELTGAPEPTPSSAPEPVVSSMVTLDDGSRTCVSYPASWHDPDGERGPRQVPVPVLSPQAENYLAQRAAAKAAGPPKPVPALRIMPLADTCPATWLHYPPGWHWSPDTEASASMAGVSVEQLQEQVDYWTTHVFARPVRDLDGELRRSIPRIKTRAETERFKAADARASPQLASKPRRYGSAQPDAGKTGWEALGGPGVIER